MACTSPKLLARACVLFALFLFIVANRLKTLPLIEEKADVHTSHITGQVAGQRIRILQEHRVEATVVTGKVLMVGVGLHGSWLERASFLSTTFY